MDEQAIAHLHSGCALIVGLATDDGAPVAGRAWGLRVLTAEPVEVRLLLDAGDAATRALALPGRPIAITSAHVASLRSFQLKGEVIAVDETTPADRATSAAYCDAFFGDIEAADRLPRAPLDAWAPRDVAPVTVRVHEFYRQTPGPGAGGALPLSGEGVG